MDKSIVWSEAAKKSIKYKHNSACFETDSALSELPESAVSAALMWSRIHMDVVVGRHQFFPEIVQVNSCRKILSSRLGLSSACHVSSFPEEIMFHEALSIKPDDHQPTSLVM